MSDTVYLLTICFPGALKPNFVEPQYATLTQASSLTPGMGYYLSKSSMIILYPLLVLVRKVWPESHQWFLRSLMTRIFRNLILDFKKKKRQDTILKYSAFSSSCLKHNIALETIFRPWGYKHKDKSQHNLLEGFSKSLTINHWIIASKLKIPIYRFPVRWNTEIFAI